MWTERLTVYYSRERQYAVRWLKAGQGESQAQYKKFTDRLLAEKFYQDLVDEHPDVRAEVFFSQAKWIAYHGNRGDSGVAIVADVQCESDPCLASDHQHCSGEFAADCTCQCHAD